MTRKCQKCASGQPHTFNHGTLHSYAYHDCRCADCKRGARATCNKWREANPEHTWSYSHHTRAQRREYYQKNRDSFRRSHSVTVEKFQRAAGDARRRSWTPEEDAVVMRSDLSLLEIAYLLGRNRGSLLYRRGVLRKEQAA